MDPSVLKEQRKLLDKSTKEVQRMSRERDKGDKAVFGDPLYHPQENLSFEYMQSQVHLSLNMSVCRTS